MDVTRPLSQSKIDYVFFHWGLHVHLSSEIRSAFTVLRENITLQTSGRIIFHQSTSPLVIPSKNITELPVLFPVLNRPDFYFIDENKNLVFTHDVLKAIFYLLSGAQEIDSKAEKDTLGRYAYENSIQYKGGFIYKPIVNYYFERMTEGLEKFCFQNNLPFEKKRLFKDFGFLLSHDIDRVDVYTYNQFVYQMKELLGLAPSRLPFSKRCSVVLQTFLKWSGILKNDNPYWNFIFLRDIEKTNQFKSTFFFLDQGVLHADAYHSFSEPRMKRLFEILKNDGCEIAMHGATKSSTSKEIMQNNKLGLEMAAGVQVLGNRQHRLLWSHSETPGIEESIGLRYDATLGFAAHEGFRNSYCGPFRLYDFANDRMLNMWEFSLNVMDVTLFAYRGLTPGEAMNNCESLIQEVKKFGGVFSLLWHNSFFDETNYPGVTDFYKDLLSYIAAQKPESLTGIELLNRLEV